MEVPATRRSADRSAAAASSAVGADGQRGPGVAKDVLVECLAGAGAGAGSGAGAEAGAAPGRRAGGGDGW